jgi:hypothetical protein
VVIYTPLAPASRPARLHSRHQYVLRAALHHIDDLLLLDGQRSEERLHRDIEAKDLNPASGRRSGYS